MSSLKTDNPYICGLCGHECASVSDQAYHFVADHPDFDKWAREVTGRTVANPVLDDNSYRGFQQVIEQDPLTLLHKLQLHVAIRLLASGYASQASNVTESMREMLWKSVKELEQIVDDYPGAVEPYLDIATSCNLLGKYDMAADYWLGAIAAAGDINSPKIDRRMWSNIGHSSFALKDRPSTRFAAIKVWKAFPLNINRLLHCIYVPFSAKEKDLRPGAYSLSEFVSKPLPSPDTMALTCRRVLARMRNRMDYHDQLVAAARAGELEETDELIEVMEANRQSLIDRIAEIRKCQDMTENDRLYWQGHLELLYSYHQARANNTDESLSGCERSISHFAELEDRVPYPDYLPKGLIEDYTDGRSFCLMMAKLMKPGIYSQMERHEEASVAYADCIVSARAYRDITDDFLIESLRKAAEHQLFSIGLAGKASQAMMYLEEVVQLIESHGTLVDFMDANDLSLLRAKDFLALAYEMGGRKEEAEALKAELVCFKEFMYWKVESNIFEDAAT